MDHTEEGATTEELGHLDPFNFAYRIIEFCWLAKVGDLKLPLFDECPNRGSFSGSDVLELLRGVRIERPPVIRESYGMEVLFKAHLFHHVGPRASVMSQKPLLPVISHLPIFTGRLNVSKNFISVHNVEAYQSVEERSKRLFELKTNSVVVQSLDFLYYRLKDVTVSLANGKKALHTEDNVFGFKLTSVMEFHSLAKMESIRKTVFGHFPRFSKMGYHLTIIGGENKGVIEVRYGNRA